MQEKQLKRSEVREELTWRLEDIYENEDILEKEMKEVDEVAEEIAHLEGRMGESASNLLKAFELYEKSEYLIDRVYGYTHMRQDQETTNTKYQGLNQRAMSALVGLNQKIAFFEPEILTLSDEQIGRYYKEAPGLEKYRVSITEIRRLRDHILDKDTEQLLASAEEMKSACAKTYEMLDDADMKFPSVKDGEGKEIQLTGMRFVPLQESKDRTLRKNSFEALYGRYNEFRNTYASLYDGEVKGRIFAAKARKYNNIFEAAVNGNNVSPKVCDNLFESIHDNMDKMHRYVDLRKKLLGVDELHMYDVYVSMIPDFDMKVSYDEAKEISLKALAPLGEDYLEIVKKAYDERWIDVVDNEGKRGGAYSSGVYSVHPYMLLNYTDTLGDVFTLVHEMGHSMHTWYSSHAQSILDSQYKIFVAEVASTTNEILLYNYLKNNAEDKNEKAYLINTLLERFKATMYRQTMFEEFERKTGEMAEQGIPLTEESLSEVYYNLNKEYFGKDMISDDLIRWEWCRIPHFYYNFYVYQYATSFAAAVAIADRILTEGEPAVKAYKQFLSSGCTQDPVSLLKIAGVDLTTREPIDRALKIFEKALDEMEEVMA